MTDRAQPGAIDSVIRNDELAQVLGQLTGGFNDGWVVDPADPTAASRRRTGINESAFDGFALSNVSSSSLSLDVGPGEAFAGGWIATDASKSVNLPANTTSTIVALMDLDAIFDPQNDPDRDAADKVVIDIAANVSDDLPRVRLHEATTDGSGVTATTDLRTPYGPTLEANTLTIGGTLYELDGRLEFTGSSNETYNVSGSFDDIVILFDIGGARNGPIQLQVNGDTGSNYKIYFSDDTVTTGNTQFQFSRPSGVRKLRVYNAFGDRIRYSTAQSPRTGQPIAGENKNVSGNITSLTFSDPSIRDLDALILGRSI